jgi:hypothetical protein
MRTIKTLVKNNLLMMNIMSLTATALRAQEQKPSETFLRHGIQTHTLESSIGHIYSAQYFYGLNPKNYLVLGLGYQNIKYDFGTTHAPCLNLGYRRYLWKNLYAEYTLWPAYNWFYEKKEKKYYNGLELWGEGRIGYDINFTISKTRFFITPQFCIGKGIIRGNKPESFKEYYKTEEKIFMKPNIAVGFKF